MVKIAMNKNLNEYKIKNCFIIVYNHDVGHDKRLEDIKYRYGEESEVYNKCCKLVNEIRCE